MKDTIYREDAIKALYKYSFVSKAVIEKEINAIPSADRPQDDDWEKYSDKLWRNAYERGKEEEHRWWTEHCANCTDADRPQGEWIDRGMRVPSSWVKKCSLCGHETDTWRWCNFCPNYGARMKGADDEDN